MILTTLCNAVTELVHNILQHPFNQELAHGTLPKKVFNHYLEQDALYLSDFSKALAITAARLPNTHQSQQFLQLSLNAIQAENALHLNYLGKQPTKQQSPACFMYTNFILKMASLSSVEEAVACLLPCFWVYRDVGRKIAVLSSQNNPYHDWITLYAGEEFNQSVDAIVQITNDLGDTASEAIKDKMCAAFVQSTQLEWLFWDGAYHQKTWIC